MTQPQNTPTMGGVYQRYVTWVNNATVNKLWGVGVLLGFITVGLAVSASIPFIKADWFIYVQTLVGFPAGLSFFGLLLIIKERTNMKHWEMFQAKQKYSYARRIKITVTLAAVTIILFIIGGTVLPYGVGGTLLITIISCLMVFLMRTPTELNYAKLGVVDPRDIGNDGVIDTEAVLDLTQNNTDGVIKYVDGYNADGEETYSEARLTDLNQEASQRQEELAEEAIEQQQQKENKSIRDRLNKFNNR